MIIALKKAILLSYSKWNSSKRCAAKSFPPPRFDTLPTTSVSLQAFRKQPYSIRKTLRLYNPQLLETQPAGKHLPESYQHWKRENMCALSPQYEWFSLVKYTIQQFRCTLCRRDPKNGTFFLPFRFFRLWKFIRKHDLLRSQWKIRCADGLRISQEQTSDQQVHCLGQIDGLCLRTQILLTFREPLSENPQRISYRCCSWLLLSITVRACCLDWP